jgi:dCTP deaminase
LSGKKLIEEMQKNKIIITPFKPENVNPNSYDISIGSALNFYESDAALEAGDDSKAVRVNIPDSGIVLKKHKFYFAESFETVISDNYVPMLHNRSGVARKGLFIHITADLLQLHHKGTIKLQLYPEYDIKISAFQKIAQISFWEVYR